MKEVTIYSTLVCPYCYKAKRLLNKLEISFTEISVDFKPKLREKMAAKAGKTSVPQIWFGDSHIGGCDELFELYYAGGLFKALS
tara:strand:+ start:46996 stop:47247 length:252 start_codon:yes stop_codon:yes gene_type:complete